MENKVIEVLNDLIRINNDRIAGYEKAASESRIIDVDLKAIFDKMAGDSRSYVAQLIAEVSNLGGEPASDTTVSGKIYRAWMDVKTTFTGKDRAALLASCEYGEDAAQRAYEEALTTDVELPAYLRQLIVQQQTELKSAHDLIKKYRDMHETMA
jgi:uncharacterized protein (TIGR02284 family)